MSDSPLVLPMPTQFSYDGVDNYLSQLDLLSKANPGRPLELDWTRIDRIDPGAAVILSNALVGSFAGTDLIVTLPVDVADIEKLTRVGLVYGLANRDPNRTQIVGANVRLLSLPFWSTDWSQKASTMPRLFEGDVVGEEDIDVEGVDYAAFVNPHLSPFARDGMASAAQRTRPWLIRLLPEWRGRASSPRFDSFIIDLNRIVSELVRNIQRHALRRPDNGAPTTSLAKLTLAKDKIYVTIQDDGPGIAQTARPKVAAVAPAYAAEPDAQLVARLMAGDLPPWGSGNGWGLPRVARAAKCHKGALRIASGRVRLSSSDGFDPHESDLSIQGTVIITTLMLPSSRDNS